MKKICSKILPHTEAVSVWSAIQHNQCDIKWRNVATDVWGQHWLKSFYYLYIYFLSYFTYELYCPTACLFVLQQQMFAVKKRELSCQACCAHHFYSPLYSARFQFHFILMPNSLVNLIYLEFYCFSTFTIVVIVISLEFFYFYNFPIFVCNCNCERLGAFQNSLSNETLHRRACSHTHVRQAFRTHKHSNIHALIHPLTVHWCCVYAMVARCHTVNTFKCVLGRGDCNTVAKRNLITTTFYAILLFIMRTHTIADSFKIVCSQKHKCADMCVA